MKCNYAMLALFAGVGLSISVSRAQDSGAPTTPSGSQLEEITVTAERREANLQQVPITIEAIGADALSKENVTDTSGLIESVPGLTFQRDSSFATPFLRGVGTTATGPEVESSVALYVDGVYIRNESALLFSLNNIDHVEVLKGPQGTLFGRNASGGVIQIVTREPSETPSAELSVGYGSYNTAQGSFYGTTGITDHLAVDVAIQTENQADGWGTNLATGQPAFTSRNVAARSKLLWTPSDSTSVTLAVDASYDRDEVGAGWTLLPGERGVDGVFLNRGFFDPSGEGAGDGDFNTWRTSGASLTVKHSMDWAKIVSISAERYENSTDSLDLDATPLSLETVTINTGEQAYSQELQLLSVDSRRLQWISGVYFLHDVGRLDPDHLFGSAFGAGNFVDLNGTATTDSYAAFGQTTYEVITDTHLTTGVRYTEDKKEIAGYTASDGVLIPPTDGRQYKTFSKWTWRLALDHQFTPDLLAFISDNRGFKSGSFSVTNALAPPVNPEVVDAYEGGFKSEWLEHRLRINASYFYYNFRDLQVEVLDASTGSQNFVNAARSKIRGLDLDVETTAAAGLTVTGGLELLHARYVSFPNAVGYVANPLGGDTQVSVNASGNQMVNAPNVSGNIGADYLFPRANGAQIDLAARGTYIDDYAVNADDRLKEPSVFLLSATGTWTLADKRSSVRLWGTNLANKHYYTFLSEESIGDIYSPAAPRTYGLTYLQKFGH